MNIVKNLHKDNFFLLTPPLFLTDSPIGTRRRLKADAFGLDSWNSGYDTIILYGASYIILYVTEEPFMHLTVS
jgi:hypothetical protein